jgi:hypothetical protein
MIYEQATRKIWLEPASFTNGATASVVIDRMGQAGSGAGLFDYVSVDIALGHVSATNLPPTTVEIQEADVNAATNFTTLTNGTSLSTSATTATFSNLVPSTVSLTSGVQTVKVDIDARNRKRYLQLVVVPATTQVIAAVATLSRGKIEPATSTDQNVTLAVLG